MTHPHASPVDPSDFGAWHAWADSMLAPMDLSVRLLHQAVEAGQRKLDAASPLAPKITPGSDRWSGTVIALRAGTGFRPEECGGQPRTVHPSGAFYIVVRTGSGNVGRFGDSEVPTPKYPLKSTLRRAIDGTPSTIPLFDLDGDETDFDAYQEPKLWLLLMLYHDGVIYSELSQPSKRAGDVVTAYSQRIQLPPLPFKGTPTDLLDEDDIEGEEPDDGPGLNINVEPLL